ncbi:MAG: hypothetical protein JNL01_02815 [Bdellovibrionales bacterium]|nr:hypothetical protein [Bdellovibrionales bacterium]
MRKISGALILLLAATTAWGQGSQSGKKELPRLDVNFEVVGSPHRPVIRMIIDHDSTLEPESFQVDVTRDVEVTVPAKEPDGEPETKTETQAVCQTVLPKILPSPSPSPSKVADPKPSPSPGQEAVAAAPEPEPSAEPSEPPKPYYKLIGGSSGNCPKLSYRRTTEFKVKVTPLGKTGKPLTIHKESKLDEALVFPDHIKFLRYKVAPLTGVFMVKSQGEDGRLLKGPMAFMGSMMGTAMWWKWTGLLKLDYGSANYGATSATWFRAGLTGMYDLIHISDGNNRMTIHAAMGVDLTSHPIPDFRTDFAETFGGIKLIPQGGITLVRKGYTVRGMLGYMQGLGNGYRGNTASVYAKVPAFETFDVIGVANYRRADWTTSTTGVPGNDYDWSIQLGLEFELTGTGRSHAPANSTP